MLKKILMLTVAAILAWLAGLAFIAITLYFVNGGADFTGTDLMGFGVITVVASGLLMLVLYLPSLHLLRRRRASVHPRILFAVLTGIACNLPAFVVLAFLIDRKMELTEACGFMATFLIIGVVFGFGFTIAENGQTPQAGR
jgi:hypothetical protein